jgi:hypothetical protein
MADSAVYSDSLSHNLSEITGNIHESNRKKCSEYESQVREAVDELGSAREIIEILQEELSTCPSTNNAYGKDPVSSKELGKPVNSKEWTLVTARNYTLNPNKSVKHIAAMSD